MIEYFIEVFGFFREKAVLHFDVLLSEQAKTAAGMLRIRICGGYNDTRNAKAYNGLGAGRRTARGAAWFESNVEGCIAQSGDLRESILDRFDFSMSLAGALMPAFTDNPTAMNKHRPNHRIRRSATVTTFRQDEGAAHEFPISLSE